MNRIGGKRIPIENPEFLLSDTAFSSCRKRLGKKE